MRMLLLALVVLVPRHAEARAEQRPFPGRDASVHRSTGAHHHAGRHRHRAAHHAHRRVAAHHARHRVHVRSRDRISLAGLPAGLVRALNKVERACDGFRVISTFRPGARVAGSGRTSLHALHKAADFVVSRWRCAYAALRGFPGGLSIDPARVHHIHASYWPGGREWHARFAHYGSHHWPRTLAFGH